MTDITPADLAKFVHRVPVGATIPAGTRYASLSFGCIEGPKHSESDQKVLAGSSYWTAQPIRTAEHQRLEDEYAKACEDERAAQAKVRAAQAELDARSCTAERLLGALIAAGHR